LEGHRYASQDRAAATVAILLGLAASPSRADDVNYLEISLLKYHPTASIGRGPQVPI
jgi:hypothetical protein